MRKVIDASALVDLMLGVVPSTRLDAFAGDLAAPDLIYVDVTNALRTLCRRGVLDGPSAELLLEWALDLPLDIAPTRTLMARALQLGDRLTTYDGCYVALAESEDVPLVTADRKLGRTHGLPVSLILV